MKTMLVSSLLLVTLVSRVSSEQCQHPPPSPHFNNSLYSGRWYEVCARVEKYRSKINECLCQVGKYQTLGGSIFQQDTVCTIATYDPFDLVSGGGDIGYSSRKHSPSGDWVNATGTLTQLESPGHFSQQLSFGGFEGPDVDYNVIWLDQDSAIE